MILAIDTSGSHCGVALWQDSLVGFLESDKKLKHNEILLSQIKYLLKQYDVINEIIDDIAVASGPGSFTGLRVGMAAAKGLCWSWKIPLIAISTLEGLVAALPKSINRALPLMPARANEVYWALFERDMSGWRRQCDDSVIDISALNDSFQGDVFLCGEGYEKHKADLDSLLKNRITKTAPSERNDPLVVSTARLAKKRLDVGVCDDLMQTEPIYCHPFPIK